MPRRLADRVTRTLELPADAAARAEKLRETEWLVTNGLGGYSSLSVSGALTRRYHGILVAALANPLGRTVMLNHLEEKLAGAPPLDVEEMRLEAGLPVWTLRAGDACIEKRVIMPHQQNTVHITYQLIEGPARATLELRPSFHFRGYEDAVNEATFAPNVKQYRIEMCGATYTVTNGNEKLPPLKIRLSGAQETFVRDEKLVDEVIYPVEQHRGYAFQGALWSPGQFTVELSQDARVTFVASVESDDVMNAMSSEEATAYEYERRRRLVDAAAPEARDEIGAELVLAADQFIITPIGRTADATRAAALGHEIRTVIAGYHWFTDWGRDTMISLEGLALSTGRHREASFILRTFARYVREGLIPNMFPDGSSEGLYHTADATLWFFHAVAAYERYTGDRRSVLQLLPVLTDIVEHHVNGTRFGIGVDPSDGLLRQGEEGYQLTWMDAKVDGWVVTPRRGKPVEINALWYNALRLLQNWLEEFRGEEAATEIRARADRVYESFNARFWNEERNCLFDVLDGDPAEKALCRPNQIFAIALDHPVLDQKRWDAVVETVRTKLLTPVGLRSLAPGDEGYKSRYYGDLRARDAAYHQGTVWGWLIGPWIDAWLKLHPDDRVGANRYLDGCIAALGEFGFGSIGEIFDADSPFTPRGCIAQAWSVAEVLRCWIKTAAD
jgi:predicted glycogen debranching enzyme